LTVGSNAPSVVLVPHAPLTQASPAGQTALQLPQLLGSELRLASQPSKADALQSAKGDLHPNPQTPTRQPVVAFARLGQISPQTPQLVGSALVSVQPDAQHVCPARQAFPPLHPPERTHDPLTHEAPRPQIRPQLPQLAESVSRLASQPLNRLPSQSANGRLHVLPQTPPVQIGAALA
jgi:hypothetical protein